MSPELTDEEVQRRKQELRHYFEGSLMGLPLGIFIGWAIWG